jgi:hypothetical protein
VAVAFAPLQPFFMTLPSFVLEPLSGFLSLFLEGLAELWALLVTLFGVSVYVFNI